MPLPLKSEDFNIPMSVVQLILSPVEFKRYKRLSTINDKDKLKGPKRRQRLLNLQTKIKKITTEGTVHSQ